MLALRPLRSLLRPSLTTFTTVRALSNPIPRLRDFSRPGPPPLPAAEQAEFERLQKAAEVAVPAHLENATPEELLKATEELAHRDLRRGAAPEFTGDVNPKTGEVGGPKRDPFQAGEADWAFGGRVTVSPRELAIGKTKGAFVEEICSLSDSTWGLGSGGEVGHSLLRPMDVLTVSSHDAVQH